MQTFYHDEPPRTRWPWRHWSAHPQVRQAINRRISGDPDVDLVAALARVLPTLGLSLPAGEAASLGCGQGALDRSLARHGIVGRLVGCDVSPVPLEIAREAAAAAGLLQLTYLQANLDDLTLEPDRYDLIVAEMSLHHVARLEQLYEVVAQALRPGGLLVIDEYVGPTRFQWTPRQMQAVNALLELTPQAMRVSPEGIDKPPIQWQEESYFRESDPSEAIRSADVLPCLRQRFEVLWERPYGGTLLHPLLHDIAFRFVPGDLLAETLLDSAIRLEGAMERRGDIGSDFVALIARPR